MSNYLTEIAREEINIPRWRNYETQQNRYSETKIFPIVLTSGNYTFKIIDGEVILSVGSAKYIGSSVFIYLVNLDDGTIVKQLFVAGYGDTFGFFVEQRRYNLPAGYTTQFTIDKPGRYGIFFTDRTWTTIAGANCAGVLDCSSDIELRLQFSISKRASIPELETPKVGGYHYGYINSIWA